jgi:hypothetical protein
LSVYPASVVRDQLSCVANQCCVGHVELRHFSCQLLNQLLLMQMAMRTRHERNASATLEASAFVFDVTRRCLSAAKGDLTFSTSSGAGITEF